MTMPIRNLFKASIAKHMRSTKHLLSNPLVTQGLVSFFKIFSLISDSTNSAAMDIIKPELLMKAPDAVFNWPLTVCRDLFSIDFHIVPCFVSSEQCHIETSLSFSDLKQYKMGYLTVPKLSASHSSLSPTVLLYENFSQAITIIATEVTMNRNKSHIGFSLPSSVFNGNKTEHVHSATLLTWCCLGWLLK